MNLGVTRKCISYGPAAKNGVATCLVHWRGKKKCFWEEECPKCPAREYPGFCEKDNHMKRMKRKYAKPVKSEWESCQEDPEPPRIKKKGCYKPVDACKLINDLIKARKRTNQEDCGDKNNQNDN